MNRVASFLKESKIELKKVTWPTREDAIRHTVVVIILSLVIAAFLGTLDKIFQFLLSVFVL